MQEVPANYRSLPGTIRHPVSGARRVADADPGEVLTVSIYVRRRTDAPKVPDLAHWASLPTGKRN